MHIRFLREIRLPAKSEIHLYSLFIKLFKTIRIERSNNLFAYNVVLPFYTFYSSLVSDEISHPLIVKYYKNLNQLLRLYYKSILIGYHHNQLLKLTMIKVIEHLKNQYGLNANQ